MAAAFEVGLERSSRMRVRAVFCNDWICVLAISSSFSRSEMVCWCFRASGGWISWISIHRELWVPYHLEVCDSSWREVQASHPVLPLEVAWYLPVPLPAEHSPLVS